MPFTRWPLAFCLCALAVASSLVRTTFAPLPDRLEATGLTVAAYHAAGAALIIVILVSAYSAGALLQRVFLHANKRVTRHTLDGLIVCLLLGFAAIGILMVVLGFAALLYRPVALGLATILCLAAPFLWNDGVRATPHVAAPELSPPEKWPARLLLTFAVFAAIALAANRGLFWGDLDGDEWEHYLHYIDLVVRTHSVWPNDVWYHFYLSKGAGVFFFAALLGDPFSVQLASIAAAIVIALLACSFVRNATGRALPGLAAAALLLASWQYIAGAAGNVTKHHTIIALLMVGLFWCIATPVLSGRPELRRPCLMAGIAAGFYLAFFVPVSAAIVVTGLALAAVVLFDRAGLRSLRDPLFVAGASAAGCVLALAVNYAVTGLALDAPVEQFWGIADKMRFASVWSAPAIEYFFIGPQSFEAQPINLRNLVPDVLTWLDLLRLHWLAVSAATFLAAAILALWLRRSDTVLVNRQILFALALLAAFVLGTLLIGQIFRSVSVYRLYAFELPLVIAAIILLAWIPLSQIDRPIAAWIVIAAVALPSYRFLTENPERWRFVPLYIAGITSARDAVRNVQDRFIGRVSVDNLVDFRKAHPDGGKLLMLTYDVSPAYFIPWPPAVSEPTYAFGRRYGDILFGPAAQSKELLKSLGIRYFAINLRTRLFLGIPYSDLFSEANLTANFGLAFHDRDVFILGWRDEGVTEPLPDKFVSVFKTKRTGIFPPDAETWGGGLEAYLRWLGAYYNKRDRSGTYYDWLFAEMKRRFAPGQR